MPGISQVMARLTIPCVAVLLLAVSPPATAQPRKPESEVAASGPIRLADLMAMMAAVPERRAVFHEEKRFAALTETLKSSGYLLYRRPDHLEKVTESPQPERLVVDGNRLSVTEAHSPAHVTDIAAEPQLRVLVDAMRGPMAGDLTALEREFRVTVAGTKAAWRLDLDPIDPGVTRLLAEVRISGAGTAMDEVLVVQANGDTQYMSIEPAS